MKYFQQGLICSELGSRRTVLAAGWRLGYRSKVQVGDQCGDSHLNARRVTCSKPVLGMGDRDIVEEVEEGREGER